MAIIENDKRFTVCDRDKLMSARAEGDEPTGEAHHVNFALFIPWDLAGLNGALSGNVWS